MEIADAVIESWDRQTRIVNSVAERVNGTNRLAKPSVDGWPLLDHLAHIHQVRKFHLAQLDRVRAHSLNNAFRSETGDPIEDLDELRRLLRESASAVREVVAKAITEGKEGFIGFDHPLFLVEHLVFHEGWHLGLIVLGLRLAGQEPPRAWEEAHVWGEWRTD